jgi:hypothetical protein
MTVFQCQLVCEWLTMWLYTTYLVDEALLNKKNKFHFKTGVGTWSAAQTKLVGLHKNCTLHVHLLEDTSELYWPQVTLHLVFVLSQAIFGFFTFSYTTELIFQLRVKGLYSHLWTLKTCLRSTNFIYFLWFIFDSQISWAV